MSGNVQALLLLHLVLLVDDLDDDQTHAAGNAHTHQYEHPRHVLQTQSIGRLLEELAILLDMSMKDPLLSSFSMNPPASRMDIR